MGADAIEEVSMYREELIKEAVEELWGRWARHGRAGLILACQQAVQVHAGYGPAVAHLVQVLPVPRGFTTLTYEVGRREDTLEWLVCQTMPEQFPAEVVRSACQRLGHTGHR